MCGDWDLSNLSGKLQQITYVVGNELYDTLLPISYPLNPC